MCVGVWVGGWVWVWVGVGWLLCKMFLLEAVCFEISLPTISQSLFYTKGYNIHLKKGFSMRQHHKV